MVSSHLSGPAITLPFISDAFSIFDLLPIPAYFYPAFYFTPFFPAANLFLSLYLSVTGHKANSSIYPLPICLTHIIMIPVSKRHVKAPRRTVMCRQQETNSRSKDQDY